MHLISIEPTFNTSTSKKMQHRDSNSYIEHAKLSPIVPRTQGSLSPSPDSPERFRFGAKRASLPDRDADCESGAGPDSPNLSNVDTSDFASCEGASVKSCVSSVM